MKLTSLKLSVLAIVATCMTQPVLAAGGKSKVSSFDEIDKNADGYISSSEAQVNDRLSDEWSNLDVDNNDRLDESEFSAFETMMMEDPSMQQDQAPGSSSPDTPAPGSSSPGTY